MTTHYEVRRFSDADSDAAGELLAARHRRHRRAVPALDAAYEDGATCAALVAERCATDGALGAIAFAGERPAGFVLFTRRATDMWGPNAWAEDTGNAGEAEAIRACYALAAGDLVDAGIRAHWAMVPASDADLVDAWFSMSFGKQHDYAFQAPVGIDFRPQPRAGLTIRRPTAADIPALARLDLVLPKHLIGAPVFSKVTIPSLEEDEAELAEDLENDKYTFWVAEHDGAVIGTLVGTSLESSSSWGPLMKPRSCGFLGYAATFPEGRGLGAGRALTDTFKAWARDEGYEWLATDWRSGNVEANRTWRAMGFEPGFYRLFRSIP